MVHLDTPVCKWHFNQLGLTDDLSLAVYHVPYPYKPDFALTIKQATKLYDHIIVLCSELHNDSVEFIKSHQYPNVHYFTCGFIEGVNTYPWMDWFITTCNIYKNTSLLEQLTPYVSKPKYFDALLGWSKPHRQIAYEYLKDNDRVILSYLQDRSKSLSDNGWYDAEECLVGENIRNTISKINYHNSEVSVSQIIPFGVYNRSAYTIVAETNYENSYSFYTEKIVKPIVAERMFLVFSGQHYLRNLRSLGFKTFNSIIDESYDNESDMATRFSMINEQINYLLAQSQDVILEKIQPITSHNKQHMINTDWTSTAHCNIKNIIYPYN